MISDNSVVIHVPHASTIIPKEYLDGILFSKEELEDEILWATDILCDDLFAPAFGTRVIAESSRLACDVERMRDDADEPCALFGNGLLYTHTQRGIAFRQPDNALRERALIEIYDPHHLKLTAAVNDALCASDTCLIIDGHSFCDDLAVGENLPDFCLGTDGFHTPGILIERAKSFLESKGYSVAINYPYSGSMVPMAYYKKDKRVKTLMLEMNKRLYLNQSLPGGSNQYLHFCEMLSDRYPCIKETITELIMTLIKSGEAL